MPIRSQFLRSKIWLLSFLFWIASKIRRGGRSQQSREDVTMLSQYIIWRRIRVATLCTSWSTREAMIESLPGATLFNGVLPTHSLAVDDTKLCDLYVPSEFSSAQHLLDTIAPADLLSLLGSVSFWWIAAFLLWLRKAYYEVTASIMQGEDVESRLLMKTQAIEWRYLCLMCE